jgi:hypothetical protein
LISPLQLSSALLFSLSLSLSLSSKANDQYRIITTTTTTTWTLGTLHVHRQERLLDWSTYRLDGSCQRRRISCFYPTANLMRAKVIGPNRRQLDVMIASLLLTHWFCCCCCRDSFLFIYLFIDIRHFLRGRYIQYWSVTCFVGGRPDISRHHHRLVIFPSAGEKSSRPVAMVTVYT